MKRFVDGMEVELDEADATPIHLLSDRLSVHGPDGTFSAVAVRSGDAVLVSYRGRQFRIERSLSRARAARGGETGEIFAPMPGLIVEVLVAVGESVKNGQKLLVLEAMKTQQAFVAPFDGHVSRVAVQATDQVVEGQELIVVEPLPSN